MSQEELAGGQDDRLLEEFYRSAAEPIIVSEVNWRYGQQAATQRVADRRGILREILSVVSTLIRAAAVISLGVWQGIDLGASGWLGLGICFAALGAMAVGKLATESMYDPRMSARMKASFAGVSVQVLTCLAAFLAGREGAALLDESDGHLAGWDGHDPLSWAKIKEAAGFVIAGVRYRGQGWADAGWRPVDVVLRSRFLSGLFVAVPVIMIAFEVLTHKGTMTLFTSLGSIFGTWTFLAGAIKGGRKYRDAFPPEPKARQAKK